MEQIPKMIINLYRNEYYYSTNNEVKKCNRKNSEPDENSTINSQAKSISAQDAEK